MIFVFLKLHPITSKGKIIIYKKISLFDLVNNVENFTGARYVR